MFRNISLVLVLALVGCDKGKVEDTLKESATSGGDNDGGDADLDGFRSIDAGGDDCDDNDSSVNPGAEEICNSIDDNCDGSIDEGVKQTYYQDFDEDGFGNPDVSTDACSQPSGYVTTATDCDDGDGQRFPGNQEICDGIDNDCDDEIDEGVSYTYYADADGDGFGDPDAATQACSVPDGYVENDADCDDTSYRSFPENLEICDEIDNNCDGTVDEGVTTTYYADRDGDRYGDASMTTEACALPTGYASNDDDCNDTNADANPGETEVCNGVDDDCDGSIDESGSSGSTVYYRDADGDGYGDSATTATGCSAPSGYVANDDDCDDGRSSTNPGALEYCNSIDDNCNGSTDESSAVDASTWYLDADGDTYGDASASTVSCTAPARYVSDSTDCDDTARTSYPGADEVCDGADNDCDGSVDEDGGVTDGETFYEDTDSDGFGDPASTIVACSAPSGYVDNAWDCDDTDRTEPVVADVVTGTASGTGTLSSPLDSIQDAIDRSYACVIAYPGTYTEQVDLSGKSIDVWGVEGEDYTTIDANLPACSASSPTGCGAAVIVDSASNASPTIHGFTITGGSGQTSSSSSSTSCADSSSSHNGRNTCTVTVYEYCGGGIYVDGDDPYFYDVIVRDNVLPSFEQTEVGSFQQYWLYSYGGGACVKNSNAIFENAWFLENDADQGGGVYATDASNFSLENSVVSENTASDGAGINLDGASASVSNAVIACNDASTDGGGLFTESSGTATVLNVVFYQNTSSTTGSSRGSEAYVGSSTTLNLTNSIAEANFSRYALYGAGGSGSLSYNNVYNAAGSTYGGTLSAGAGSISAGSNFTRATCDGNPYNDDFTLKSTSSSLDAGNPAAAYNDVDGTRNDMGAYGGPDGSW